MDSVWYVVKSGYDGERAGAGCADGNAFGPAGCACDGDVSAATGLTGNVEGCD